MRFSVLILVLPLLAACGFHPLYTTGAGGDVDARLAQVQIVSIPNREGQELRNLLTDKMQYRGRSENPRYDLTVGLQEIRSDLGIRTDATSARSKITMTAQYRLVDRTDGKTAFSASATTSVGFNKLDAQYSNLAAEEDARRRALSELGEQIVSRLSLYFDHIAPAL